VTRQPSASSAGSVSATRTPPVAALQRQHERRRDGALTASELLDYLPRDPAAPYRWDDVVAAMQKAGRTDAARYSPARAVALAPNSSPALLMAAGFHLDVGEHRQAFRLMSRSLQTSDAFDHAVFGDLDVRGVRADEILPCGSIR
jgi:hypothetical protein